MIKTIVFDLGGVVFAEGKDIALKNLQADLGYDPELINGLMTSEKSQGMRRGLVSNADYWQWAATQLPSGYDTATIKQYWYDGYILDDDVFKLLHDLQGKYRLVIFSDNERGRIDYLEQKYHFRSLFDAEVYSFDKHLIKTDKGFVDFLFPVCNAEPNEIVYIDDKENVVNEPRARGINVLIYKRGEIEALKHKLKSVSIDV